MRHDQQTDRRRQPSPGLFTGRQVKVLGLLEAAPLAFGFAIGMNAASPWAAGLAVGIGLAFAALVARWIDRHGSTPSPSPWRER